MIQFEAVIVVGTKRAVICPKPKHVTVERMKENVRKTIKNRILSRIAVFD